MANYKPQLDGLRFVCFIGVFLFHSESSRFWFGAYGVMCFLALTGWLITGLLLECKKDGSPLALRNFYIRRFLRIFPAFYFVLTVANLIQGIPFAPWHYVCLFNIKLFLLSSHFPYDQVFREYMRGWTSNGIHFWSLQMDEQYYLFYPLIVFALPTRFLGGLLLSMLVVCVGLHVWIRGHYPAALYSVIFPVFGQYILWGCLGAWSYSRLRFSPATFGKLTYAAVVGLLGMFTFAKPVHPLMAFAPFQASMSLSVYGFLFAILLLGLWGNGQTLLARALSFGPVPHLGKIGFGLYLLHLFTWEPSTRWVNLYFPQSEFKWLLEGMIRFCLSIAAALTMWHTFEKRANRLKASFSYGIKT